MRPLLTLYAHHSSLVSLLATLFFLRSFAAFVDANYGSVLRLKQQQNEYELSDIGVATATPTSNPTGTNYAAADVLRDR